MCENNMKSELDSKRCVACTGYTVETNELEIRDTCPTGALLTSERLLLFF